MSYKEKKKVNAGDIRQLRKEMALLRGKLDASNKTIAAFRLKQQDAHAKATAERRRHEVELSKELKLMRKQLEASSKRALQQQLRRIREVQSVVDDLVSAGAKAEGKQSKKTHIKWLAIEDEKVPNMDDVLVEPEKDEQKPIFEGGTHSSTHVVDGRSMMRQCIRAFVVENWSMNRHPLTHPP